MSARAEGALRLVVGLALMNLVVLGLVLLRSFRGVLW